MAPGASEYAIPKAWRELGIRRYGFRGASHKFVAERSAELLGNEVVADRARRLYVDGLFNMTGPIFVCYLAILGQQLSGWNTTAWRLARVWASALRVDCHKQPCR